MGVEGRTCAWLPLEDAVRVGTSERRKKRSFTLSLGRAELAEKWKAARGVGLESEEARGGRQVRVKYVGEGVVERDGTEEGRMRARRGSATRAEKSAKASATKETLLAVEETVEPAAKTRGEAPAEMSRLHATRGSAWFTYGTEVSREMLVDWSRAECALTQVVSVLGAEALGNPLEEGFPSFDSGVLDAKGLLSAKVAIFLEKQR